MENVNLIDTFSEFKELKNIDRPTMMSVLEDVFRSMLAKKYGSADNFDIIVNILSGYPCSVHLKLDDPVVVSQVKDI